MQHVPAERHLTSAEGSNWSESAPAYRFEAALAERPVMSGINLGEVPTSGFVAGRRGRRSRPKLRQSWRCFQG